MNSKTAIITGVSGQDGSYLAELLLDHGYKVVGITRKLGLHNNLEKVINNSNFKIIEGNIIDKASVKDLVSEYLPDEIYNFASVSNVFSPWENAGDLVSVTAVAPILFLENISKFSPGTRFFQAGSSEMFGRRSAGSQTEETDHNPENLYGLAKSLAFKATQKFRLDKNIFAANGIFYNHESPRRGEGFLTKKVVHELCKIKLGRSEFFCVGNLDAKRDWGYAKDYVEAVWKMLQVNTPSDYIVATGELHTVREFIECVCDILKIKINWEGTGLNEVGKDEQGKIILKVDESFYRKDVGGICGDIKKIKRELNWNPQTTLWSLVDLMVKAEYSNLTNENI